MQEVSYIREAMPPNAVLRRSSLNDDFIYTHADDVLQNVNKTSILHMACHGFQRPGRPLESGFMMQDKVLNVSRLISLDLPNALFAFLSACESARSDEKQPNQAITLASTLLFAGFRSVIGTMW